MSHFEYALLAMLIFGLVVNTFTLLFANDGRYYSAAERVRTAGFALAIDIALLVSCLLWY